MKKIKKYQKTLNYIYPFCFILILLILWQIVSSLGVVPRFMLPSPVDVIKAFASEFGTLMSHSAITLTEAFIGLALSILFSLVVGILMDRFEFLYKATYPLAVLTQTIPSIAIAPLLVLWLGYGTAPKIALIFITCFFPLLVGILDGFNTADKGVIKLYRSMGANYFKILLDVKLPYCMPSFFSGLRISASYAVIGAVIAEWLGGKGGLGVYMTIVRKSYAFDKMFAVIFLISIVSLLVVWLVKIIEKILTKNY